MIRILITYIIPLALPTIMFFIWSAWARKRLKAKHATDEEAQEAFEISTPWFRLIIMGVVLMAVGLILSVLFSPKNPPDSIYKAPYIENGRIVPGQYGPK